jgi:hypothetical protein
MDATWTVPSDPTNCNQTAHPLLFFWDGFEPDGSDSGGIVFQPVLSHGYNGGSYGCYYYVNVWFVYTGGSTVTPALTVYAGDSLSAATYYLGSVGGVCCYWFGQIVDNTVGHQGSRSESVQPVWYQFRWAFGAVLEAYAINYCSEYPNGSSGSTEWYNIKMWDSTNTAINPSWTGSVNSPTPLCSFSDTIAGDGSYIYLYY